MKKILSISLSIILLSSLVGCSVNTNKSYYYKIGGQIREVIPLQYDHIDSFDEGLARVKVNDKWGFIDKKGKEVIPLQYDRVDFFNGGLAKVTLNGKTGFINKAGKEVIPLQYDDAYYIFEEGLARVEMNGKWGFISYLPN